VGHLGETICVAPSAGAAGETTAGQLHPPAMLLQTNSFFANTGMTSVKVTSDACRIRGAIDKVCF